MPNEALATMIAESLATGLPHPGRANEPPRLLPLVAFRTAGMAEDMRRMVTESAKCVGEALVNLIEAPAPVGANSVIIRREDLDELRANDAAPGKSMPVVCSACKKPMLYLRVTNGRAVVHPGLLGQVNTECPHGMVATP